MIYGSVSTGSHVEKLVFEDDLGWECGFVSEIDKNASRVIRYHAPDTPNLGDFTKIEANESTRIELLCGGTPCQDFSIAGLRAGLAGERGNLTVEFLKLVDRLRPTWFLWENVPGVFSSWSPEEEVSVDAVQRRGGAIVCDERNAFDQFLAGIRLVGYQFAWRCFDAQFAGVPQRRERVFVVGHIGDWRHPAAVLLERESLQGHPAPSRGAGKRASPTVTAGPPFSRTGNSRVETEAIIPDVSGAVSSKRAKGTGGPAGDEAYNLVCVTGERTHALGSEGADASEDGTGRGTPIIPIQEVGKRTGKSTTDSRAGLGIGKDGDPMYALQNGAQHAVAFSINQRREARLRDVHASLNGEQSGTQIDGIITFSIKDHGADAGELSPTLRSMNFDKSHISGGGQVAVAFEPRHYTRDNKSGGRPTETPSIENAKKAGDSAPHIAQGMRVRRLMPIECERLQGWPDHWTRYGLRKNGDVVEISDSQRYKIIGNGWALPCIRWIAHRIALIGKLP